MQLSGIHLSRSQYGADQGKLSGSLSVTTEYGDIKLVLSEEKAEKILMLVSEQLVESAKEIAENITREIIEHRPLLDAPSEDIDLGE